MRWLRSHWEWFLAPIAAVAIVALLNARCDRANKPPPLVVTLVAPTVVPTGTPFAPVRVVRLDVSPKPLIIGESAVLLNGICNDTTRPVPVALYFGLQEVGRDPLILRTIDLIGRDTEEGRYHVVLDSGPNCVRTDPITSIVDRRIMPGRWQLVLKVRADGPAGERQNITVTSPPFDVREP